MLIFGLAGIVLLIVGAGLRIYRYYIRRVY
jgi:hypothetical protein